MTISRKPDDRDKQRGKELARLRKEAGLTQERLASMLSVSSRQYGKYERGETRMSSNFSEAALKVLIGLSTPIGLAESGTAYQAPIVRKEASKRALQRADDNLVLCIEMIGRTRTEIALALRELSE